MSDGRRSARRSAAAELAGAVLGVEADERGAQYRRCVEPDENGTRRSGADALCDPGVEGRVGGVEDAPAQDDLHRLLLQVEPDHGATDEGHDLVGQGVRRLAGRRVAVGGGVEEDAPKLEEPGVGDRSGVDAGERRLGVGRPEVGRHPFAEEGGITPAVAGP